MHYEIVSENNKNHEHKNADERSVQPIHQIYVENVAEIDQKFAELIEMNEHGLYRCTVCEKKIKNKKDMKRHLETHLGLS